MILHMDPVSFQGYGAVLPRRKSANTGPETRVEKQNVSLSATDAPVYMAGEDVLLVHKTGTVILSVSQDGEAFQDYYLDKPVRITEGIYFCLTALRGSATVCIQGQLPPMTGTRTRSEDLSISRLLHVNNLHTLLYHEKEQGFLFVGGAHPQLELTYVDQGTMHSVADGVDLPLDQGELVLYAPGQWHMQYAEIGVAPRYVTISFDIAGGDLSRLFNRRIKASPKAVALLQQMLREQACMDEFSCQMLLSLLTQLLLTLLREVDTPAQRHEGAYALHSENEIICCAQQYISTHVQEKLSVPLVARSIDISPSYLTALFHKHLQISPGEYIRRIKLQESKQMIRENAMNFTEIAAALQYSTVHHFSRQFKEKFGITPTEYARSVR